MVWAAAYALHFAEAMRDGKGIASSALAGAYHADIAAGGYREQGPTR